MVWSERPINFCIRVCILLIQRSHWGFSGFWILSNKLSRYRIIFLVGEWENHGILDIKKKKTDIKPRHDAINLGR